MLNDQELGLFIGALGLRDTDGTIEFFKHSGPEAIPENLDTTGNMTVQGLVNFYVSAAKSRSDAVVQNLETLGLMTCLEGGWPYIDNALQDPTGSSWLVGPTTEFRAARPECKIICR